jgi:hypothetical protein
MLYAFGCQSYDPPFDQLNPIVFAKNANISPFDTRLP